MSDHDSNAAQLRLDREAVAELKRQAEQFEACLKLIARAAGASASAPRPARGTQ